LAGAGCKANLPESPTPAPKLASIASVEIEPGAVLGGDGATGIVRLAGPAQTPGLFVTMSSSDDVASVPATVSIPVGSTFVRFGVTTRRVDGDRTALITASTAGGSATTKIEVWMINAPTHLLYFSGNDEPIARGGFGRFTPATSTFSATCNGNEVHISISTPGRESWSLALKAPGNGPLTSQFYEAARIGFADQWAGMDLVVGGRSCDPITGYFIIDEIDISGNGVNVLRGEFRQQCVGQIGQIDGQFRFDMALGSSTGTDCLR
jgi:hypothetical protein